MGKKEFVATDGWFHRWRKRKKVVFKKTRGEQKSADVVAADQWIEKEYLKLIALYAPKDYTMQTKANCIIEPCQAILIFSRVKVQKVIKVSKERVTILCCVSMTEYKKLLVVGAFLEL
ncbi:hypothetical protein AVEN_79426-1 [Araneus ventricosus]|uniref:HTH CENPB-type domain-containing protein n=1 Tax=Araneus ventricosus TaxID=182803 RepID=A0A4Y2RA40_ARAVE|nr:hypothetical protein AVEN_79426-1 [Araneus ventricosus]